MKPIEQIRRENLAEAIDDLFGGNQTIAAVRMGKDKPTQINHWLSGAKNMSTPSARTAEEAWGLEKFWLDTEHISAVGETKEKRQNASMIEGSTPARDPSIGDSKEIFEANVERFDGNWRRVPLLSYAQAGMMTESTDPFSLGDRFEPVLTSEDVSARAFGLRIKGLSCWPEYQEGDVVIIDPEIHPEPGNMAIAKGDGEDAVFGKYRPRGTNQNNEMVFELVPLNDDFATLNSERDHLRIIGVEVEHHKKKRRRQG
ncbi:TPA: S24 family peptidase [Burkholderia cepacia]|nr:S24 family peptidase [Burkholderia cepacia]